MFCGSIYINSKGRLSEHEILLHHGVYLASIGEIGVGINELSDLTSLTVSLFLLLTHALSCRST